MLESATMSDGDGALPTLSSWCTPAAALSVQSPRAPYGIATSMLNATTALKMATDTGPHSNACPEKDIRLHMTSHGSHCAARGNGAGVHLPELHRQVDERLKRRRPLIVRRNAWLPCARMISF